MRALPLIPFALSLVSAQAFADDLSLHYANGKFDPPQLTIAADKGVTVVVSNDSDGPFNFEFYQDKDVSMAPMIRAHATRKLSLPPMSQGQHTFIAERPIDEDESKSPSGTMIVQ